MPAAKPRLGCEAGENGCTETLIWHWLDVAPYAICFWNPDRHSAQCHHPNLPPALATSAKTGKIAVTTQQASPPARRGKGQLESGGATWRLLARSRIGPGESCLGLSSVRPWSERDLPKYRHLCLGGPYRVTNGGSRGERSRSHSGTAYLADFLLRFESEPWRSSVEIGLV